MNAKNRDMHGVEASPEELVLALSNWRDIMLLGDGWPDDDAPWWYNERASVSQLAGAIWRCRPRIKPAWVLEEFSVERSVDDRRGYGRCDLLIDLGKLRLITEAKQLWPRLDLGADIEIAAELKALQEEAASQLDSLKAPPKDYAPFTLTFISPAVTERLNADPSSLNAQLEELISATRRAGRKSTCLAWAFPASRRNTLESPRYPGTYFPGCILVLSPC